MGAPVVGRRQVSESEQRSPGAGQSAAGASDAELLGRARSGDEAAFRMLVERYEGRVASTVLGMLGDGDEAEDVGQETFTRFYRALHSFRSESSLGTYLTRIAMNASLTALKRRQSWRSRFIRQPEVDVEPVRDARDDVAELGRREAVRRAIGRLTSEHRAVVILRMIEGFSTRETAEILGVPPGTVMSRLARAMRRLEQELEGLRHE